MADRWSYASNASWVPGENIPALHAGGVNGGHSLNAAGMQLFGNCVSNLERLPMKTLKELYSTLTGNITAPCVDAVSVAAVLGGVHRKTARQWYASLNAKEWSAAFTPGKSHIQLAVGNSGTESAVGNPETDLTALPDTLPVVADVAETSSESDCDLDSFVPKLTRTRLEIWRENPNFAIGLRMAELATMWCVQGWQKDAFGQFTNWLKQHAPDLIGTLNHSTRFLNGFQASLIQACHTGAASSLHALLPATGTPSFLSRIIDVVSINSASLLPTIHMYTTCEGKLSWVLLDCPCLEHIGEAARSTAAVGTAATGTAAVGAQTTRWFGLHSAEQLINTVHRVEASFHLSRADRAFRLAVTVADQAIQGEGSVRFTQKECTMENLPVKPLAEGVCKFHITDGVGSNVDKLYGETFVFDRLLRLVRRHFAFGTGHLIFRSIAQKFEQFAEEFRKQETRCLEAVARNEANGRPLAAARMRQEAAKKGAEAAAISRAGWNKWRKPLAPRADGTRKAVYQNKARATFFDNFGLTYWGLQARVQQSLESARVARVTQGKEITAKTGLNTKEMKAWRSLGRAMLDIRVLVFNLGRVDYRKKHLAAYALECQTSLNMNLLPGDAAYTCSKEMLAAVGALVEMQGIVRMMQQICSGVVFEQRDKVGILKKVDIPKMATTWWTTLRTLLAHRCWRYFPKLAVKLPEILLGGSFNGVKLQSETFHEPGESPDQPLAVFSAGQSNTWKHRNALRRSERFEHVMHALGRVMHWAMAERRAFMTKTMGVAPPTSKRVQQTLDSDLPDVIDADVDGVHAFEESEDSVDDSMPPELETRRSFVRPAVGGPKTSRKASEIGKSKQEDNVVDLMSDNILPASTVADAAFDLDFECSKLYSVPHQLAAEDLAHVLTECTDSAEAKEEHEEGSSEDSDSEDNVPFTPVVDGFMDVPTAPVVDGFMDLEEAKRLAKLHMAAKERTPPSGDSKRRQRNAFLSLPRHTWIISRGKKTGTIICSEAELHEKLWRRRCIAQMPEREQFITRVGALFDKELFLDSPLDDLRQPLAALHQQCRKRIWGLCKNSLSYDIHKVMRTPPEELFVDISVDKLLLQFSRLRSWLQSLERAPYGHEFYEPKSFLVKAVNTTDNRPFRVSADKIDTSRWPYRYIPQLPTMASTPRYGQVEILQVEKTRDLMRFYQHIMTTELAEIRCRDVWYIVMAWHFYVHTSVSSESLAEAVGSYLAVTRRHNINGTLSMNHLVWSSKLRALGLKGFGGEDGIMAYALNTHFQCSGPEGWNFVAKRATQKTMTAVQMRNEVRLLSKPQWFHTYLFDLIATKRIHLCKPLPRPEAALLASCWRQLKPTAKRQKIEEAAEEQYNPKVMHDGLFQQLKIHTLSLPSCLRPGKNPR